MLNTISHKEIPLTKGKVALVDNDDARLLSKNSWCANIKNSHGKPYYYAVRNIYPESWTKPKLVYMHREIIGNIPPGMVVDHTNGNTLDNRRSNLRVVTRSQNYANQHQ